MRSGKLLTRDYSISIARSGRSPNSVAICLRRLRSFANATQFYTAFGTSLPADASSCNPDLVEFFVFNLK